MKVKISEIKENPNNPRFIKDLNFKKLVKSIKEFPEMLGIREVVVDETMTVLVKSKNGKHKRFKECENCGEYFFMKKYSKNRLPKYCSSKCFGEKLKIIKKCKLCDKIIKNKHSVSIKNRIYCSKKCQAQSRKNIPLSKEWRMSLSEGRKKSEKCKGKNLYNWRGGKKTLLIRSREYFSKRKRGLKKEMPIDFLNKLEIVQKGMCFYCLGDISKYKAIEHLTPVSRGGDNDCFNIVYSCKSCNSEKRQNTMEEFAIKKCINFIDRWENLFVSCL